MAKIVFLGTGGDAYLVGRGMRGAGGIIIQVAGQQFHIDPGPGSVAAAKQAGVNVRENVAVLVSSVHLHHAGDVNAVLSAMSYGGLDPHGVLLAAESVLKGYKGVLPELQPHFTPCVERVVSLQGVPRVGVNSVDIHMMPADHDDPSALGFQFLSDKERISYTGDTAYSDELAEAHKGATTLIANVTAHNEELRKTHLSPEDVIELAKKVKPKVLILTHFSHELVKGDALHLGREIGSQLKCPVVMAEDGLIVDTLTYR